jgi:general secretion pathway protein C
MSPSTLAIKAALPARWLLVAGIAYTLANTVLYFLSSPQEAGGAGRGAGAPVPSATRPDTAVDLNALLSRNLFGAVDSAAVDAQAAETPTVATRLPLELRGVFVADVAEESVAIISQKGRAGELYSVGDTVPGNATLVEVQSDHVVLRRAGAREALFFPEVAGSGMAETVESPAMEEPLSYDDGMADETAVADSDPAAETAGMEALIEDIRERVDTDPEGALAELGISPVEEGGASGYRLGDLAQSPYLSQTGLQPGDVILSINGRPVGDLSQDRLEIDNVLAQGSARLEVQRGSRRFFVTASIR